MAAQTRSCGTVNRKQAEAARSKRGCTFVMKPDVIYPPWKLVPEMDPEDPESHGLAEAYILIDWLRRWGLFTAEEQAVYLDYWNAPSSWREAIQERYDHYPIEIDRDAIRTVREMRGEEVEESKPWWRRLWTSVRRPRDERTPLG